MSDNLTKTTMLDKPQKRIPEWWYVFINEYLTNGGVGVMAYMKAKPKVSPDTAKVEASKLLTKPILNEIMSQQRKEILQKGMVTAQEWVAMISRSCLKDYQRIEESYDQMQPAPDPGALRQLTMARKNLDDMMRRCLGMPNEPVVNVTVNNTLVQSLNNLRKELENKEIDLDTITGEDLAKIDIIDI